MKPLSIDWCSWEEIFLVGMFIICLISLFVSLVLLLIEKLTRKMREKRRRIKYCADLAASKVFFYDPENERRKANREVFW